LSGYTKGGNGSGGTVIIRYISTYADPVSSSVSGSIVSGYKYFTFNSSGSITW
jgi:hypothetical protein